MAFKQSPQLSRGCGMALVSSWAIILIGGACWFWLSQLPSDLGGGLGRGNRIANILVVTTPGQRVKLSIFDGGNAAVGFPDKPGVFFRGSNLNLSDAEWQAFSTVYEAWCIQPPQRTRFTGEHYYTMGFSCATPFGRYIEVADSQIPPILLRLFERAAAIHPK